MSTQPLKPKRRWYQFSLMTLLIVMVLCCFAFAWIGSRMRQARENRERVAAVEEAVAAIEKLDGWVNRKYEERRPQTWLEEQFDDPGGADDPIGVLKVTEVLLSGTLVTDASLEHLKGLTNLEALVIEHTNVTDAGLVHLKGLTNLRILEFNGTRVTDAGLEHLDGLTNLETLHLDEADITDAGLDHLKGLISLQALYLYGTEVTDAGLEHLSGLTKLRVLDLTETKVTDAGVKKLQQTLPKCEIRRNAYSGFGHFP